jgi:hypothetical protein
LWRCCPWEKLGLEDREGSADRQGIGTKPPTTVLFAALQTLAGCFVWACLMVNACNGRDVSLHRRLNISVETPWIAPWTPRTVETGNQKRDRDLRSPEPGRIRTWTAGPECCDVPSRGCSARHAAVSTGKKAGACIRDTSLDRECGHPSTATDEVVAGGRVPVKRGSSFWRWSLHSKRPTECC